MDCLTMTQCTACSSSWSVLTGLYHCGRSFVLELLLTIASACNSRWVANASLPVQREKCLAAACCFDPVSTPGPHPWCFHPIDADLSMLVNYTVYEYVLTIFLAVPHTLSMLYFETVYLCTKLGPTLSSNSHKQIWPSHSCAYTQV